MKRHGNNERETDKKKSRRQRKEKREMYTHLQTDKERRSYQEA